MESVGNEGDLNAGTKGGEEVEFLEGDPEIPSEIGGTDQPIIYIIWFANGVKLYKKTGIVLGAAVLTIWWKIVQKISARLPEKWV